VIVTDGFTGNVTLKALEGALRVLLGALLEAFGSEEHYKPHADALLPALYPLYTQLSPDTYGGAMLLGVDGVCIISHGSSNSEAMLNAIKLAHEMVEHRLVDEIREAVALHE
jgi:phosphate acyltransferase